jgi:hypothetical protein
VIAADGNRQVAGINDFFNQLSEALAGGVNFCQVLQFVAGGRNRMWSVNWEITAVINIIPKPFDSRAQSRNAYGPRTQIDPGLALTEAHGHAKDTHPFAFTRKIAIGCMLRSRQRFSHQSPANPVKYTVTSS